MDFFALLFKNGTLGSKIYTYYTLWHHFKVVQKSAIDIFVMK